MFRHIFAITLAGLGAFHVSHAQLAITEVMPSASTNLGTTMVSQSSDWWELTNFGSNIVALTGYRWNDNAGGVLAGDSAPFAGLSIGPGESIIFFETNFPTMTTAQELRTWWNLSATQQVVIYVANGLSSTGDGVRLWDADATADADVVDSVDFPAAERGRSFTYDPTNGLFGILSTNGVNGAFKAVSADDEGSPGITTGPVPLRILQQPVSNSVNPGDTVTFTVLAGGMPRPKYQWLFQGNAVTGAHTAALTIANVQSNTLGQYSVIVSNGVTTLLSSNATLALNAQPEPPLFVVSPQNKNAFIGQRVTFTALASGVPQPVYRWYFSGAIIPNETNASYTIASAALTDTGNYQVVASNATGRVTNQVALSVTRRPRLVITEILPAQSTNGTFAGHNDWFELTNLDDFTVDLTGYRLDDSSAVLSAAVTLTNDVRIASGESIVFVENMIPEAFISWWGRNNLPANLRVITYRGGGLGLTSLGDAVNLWNAVATEDSDTIASEVFSTATMGVSFGYNPGTQTFGDLSQAGQFGAFIAPENGDIGSPGYISTPLNPRILSIGKADSGWTLSWSAIIGRAYTLQSITNLGGTNWTSIGNLTSSSTTALFTDTNAPSARKFYRVALLP